VVPLRRVRLLTAICLAVCLGASPARAFLQYDVEANWLLDGIEVLQHPQRDTPIAIDTLDFSFGGTRCPTAGSPNFLCAHQIGRAELVGSAMTVHALTKIVRRDAVGGMLETMSTDARILMSGFTAAFPQPDRGFAAFYFGLHGTLASTPSIPPSLTVETTVNAELYAPSLHEVDCLGDECPPIVIPMTTDTGATDAWNPQVHVLMLRLFTKSRILSSPGFDGWNADSIADFGDTLALLAIQPQDENHNPIAGHFVLPDGAGPGIPLDIADTPPPTTTTTSTLPGATTSTTPPATTTTSTLPATTEVCGNCIDDDVDGLVDFEQAACCPAAGVRTFTLRRARLGAAGTGSHLSVTASVADTALADVVPGHDVFLQVRGGPSPFCARIPADHLVVKHGKTAVFVDRKQTVAGAGGITKATLRGAKSALVIHLEGPRAQLALPAAGPLELVVAFRDVAGANRCSSATPAFRKAGKKGLRAP